MAGQARLQFTRIPFSHWSLSFKDEPFLDLKIESQIQGRQMQSNLTNLISTAVKKAIRRKHTLPNYKLRFKPFFKRLIFDEIDMPIDYSGTLELTLINLTRLNFPPQLKQVYGTVTLSSHSWIHAQQLNDESLVIAMDVEIHKAKNQQIGIVFKQTDRVTIESILPNTPAMISKLKSDDVLVSIEGKKVMHINQVAKILKNLTKSVITLRVERIIKGNIRNDAIAEDAADVYEDFNTSLNISFSKKSDTVSIGNENKLATIENPSQNSSVINTPKNSPKKISQSTAFPQHSTIDCSLSDFIQMNDTTSFHLNSQFKFLNVNIYGRSTSDDNTLLGYINIPLENILAECSESRLEYIEKFILNPPEFTEFTNTPLSQMSGFCSNICFGDVLMSFKWTQGSSTNRRDHKSSLHNSQEEEGDEPKKHNFIRTSFTRSTQCDFCGKKIWLKDAVQCKDCNMCCHKKCMVRSQSSTICYGLEQSDFLQLKVTDVDCPDDEEIVDENIENYKNSAGGHRQSFSDLLASGIKRVNSANSLNIPTIVSNLSSPTNSKSLPPTPQHSSRKPSLTNQQNVNPFVVIIHRLEQMPSDKTTMTQDEIHRITGPIENGDLDDLMELAKSSSEQLYIEFDMEERVTKINDLVSFFYFQNYSNFNLFLGTAFKASCRSRLCNKFSDCQ